jgi:CRISPR-associated protein Csm2
MTPAQSIQDVYQIIKNLPSMASLKPEDYAELDGYADIVAKEGNVKPTQMRKIFHYIKALKREFDRSDQNFNRAKVALVMPALAYAKGRGHIPENFYNLLVLCFGAQKCKSIADFEAAVNFLEAIMAYHKYHHPKE